MRVFVARGSMPYSAVTQPFPLLRKNGGTRSSTLAVQMTRVLPASMSTEPSACGRKSGVSVVGRRTFGGRLSDRMRLLLYPCEVLCERPSQVDVPCERGHLFSVHQQLHGLHRRQVHGERV